jgi:hypothetical protein
MSHVGCTASRCFPLVALVLVVLPHDGLLPVGEVLSSVAAGHPVGTRSALDRFSETSIVGRRVRGGVPPHPLASAERLFLIFPAALGPASLGRCHRPGARRLRVASLLLGVSPSGIRRAWLGTLRGRGGGNHLRTGTGGDHRAAGRRRDRRRPGRGSERASRAAPGDDRPPGDTVTRKADGTPRLSQRRHARSPVALATRTRHVARWVLLSPPVALRLSPRLFRLMALVPGQRHHFIFSCCSLLLLPRCS